MHFSLAQAGQFEVDLAPIGRFEASYARSLDYAWGPLPGDSDPPWLAQALREFEVQPFLAPHVGQPEPSGHRTAVRYSIRASIRGELLDELHEVLGKRVGHGSRGYDGSGLEQSA